MTRAAPSSSLRSPAARSCTTSAKPRRSAAGSANADGCFGPKDSRAEAWCAPDNGRGTTIKQKPRARARGSCVIELVASSVPAAPEPVVHAGAEDVVIELVVARRDVQALASERRRVERRVVVELDIEILALDRPAVAERVFPAAA